MPAWEFVASLPNPLANYQAQSEMEVSARFRAGCQVILPSRPEQFILIPTGAEWRDLVLQCFGLRQRRFDT